MTKQFEQAYDNFLAGCDVDTTMLDCAEFMFDAGRESAGRGEPVKQCRGYALLGTGNYLLNHSDDFHPELGVELIITLATAKDKEGNRQIGETRDNPHHRQPIQPEDMVVRIGFLNERGLFALEKQLAEIRKQFFADRPAQPVRQYHCPETETLCSKCESHCEADQPVQPVERVACSLPERDNTKPAEEQGLFRKFDVRRVDGSHAPGGKHHGCEYFVLDIGHDTHAPAALRAYAEACKDSHPQLSAELAARFGTQSVRPAGAQWEPLCYLKPDDVVGFMPCAEDDEDGFPVYTEAPAVAVNEQDRLDAARYRWLFGARTEDECQNWKVGHLPLKPQDRVIGQVATVFMPKVAVDAEIDAAIASAEAAKGSV